MEAGIVAVITKPNKLLDCLKSPVRSELSRKHKIEKPKLTSSVKKHKSGAANVTDPKSVSLTSERVSR